MIFLLLLDSVRLNCFAYNLSQVHVTKVGYCNLINENIVNLYSVSGKKRNISSRR